MEFLILLAAAVGTISGHLIETRAAGDQEPKVWEAMKELRGGRDLTSVEIQALLQQAVPGTDFPANSVIPDKVINCAIYKQAGFYADDSEPSRCQVFHYCDHSGKVKSFLCPNSTLFNQITLVCDWFYNVICSVSRKFINYSNSRLADEGAPLLDNQLLYELKTDAVTSPQKALLNNKLNSKKEGRAVDGSDQNEILPLASFANEGLKRTSTVVQAPDLTNQTTSGIDLLTQTEVTTQSTTQQMKEITTSENSIVPAFAPRHRNFTLLAKQIKPPHFRVG